MNNNRYEIRKAVHGHLELISSLWDDPVTLETTDISPEGAFTITDLPLEVGETVVVSFGLEKTLKAFCFFAEVSRVNLSRRARDLDVAGMGLRFLDAKPMERLAIRDALRKVPPPVPHMAKPHRERLPLEVPVTFKEE